MMRFRLNNISEEIEVDTISVSELLKHKNFTFKMLVIKINGKLITKSEYETALVREGDEVQVLHLISGG